jgi:YfiH family protein
MPWRDVADITLRTFDAIDGCAGVSFAITTRSGGASAQPFESLNLGGHVGDRADAVAANRGKLSALTGLEAEALSFGAQVHGTRVEVVTRPGQSFADTDALITDRPDLPLVILVADCVVIGLVDPVNGAIGIAHAGWRGTLGDIAAGTVAAMQAHLGTVPSDVLAAIGPSIGPCCYQVGPEVTDAFYATHPDIAPDVLAPPDFASAGSFEGVNDDRSMLDLWAANRLLLERAGVPDGNIDVAGICTACNTDRFYSHRAEHGRTGRFAGVIQRHQRTRRAW